MSVKQYTHLRNSPETLTMTPHIRHILHPRAVRRLRDTHSDRYLNVICLLNAAPQASAVSRE